MREKIECEKLTCDCGDPMCRCAHILLPGEQGHDMWKCVGGKWLWGDHKPKPQSAVIARGYARPVLPGGISFCRTAGDACSPDRLIDIGAGCRAVLLTAEGFEDIKAYIQWAYDNPLGTMRTELEEKAARAVGVAT